MRSDEPTVRELIAQLGAWCCVVTEDGTCKEASAAMLTGLGRQRHEVEGSPFLDWVWEPHKQDVDALVQSLDEGAGGAGVYRMLGPEASSPGCWVSWQISPLRAGACWWIGQDVTHQREEIAALQAKEERLRRFVEHVPDTFLVHDMDGWIVDVNSAASEQLGYTRQELLKRHISDIEMTIPKGSEHGIWKRMTPGVTAVIEGRHRRKDGSTFPVEARLGLFGAPGALQLHAICHDITARKRSERSLERLNQELREASEKAQAANEAKSQFLASMSHELRTPLNAITGYAELIEEELTEEDLSPALTSLRDDAKKIQRASSHLLHLISEILDLSKIEAGYLVVQWDSCIVSEIVESVCQVVRPLCQKSGNALLLVCEPDCGEMTSDIGRLKQILINLLSNANKFTQDGQVMLRVSRHYNEVLDKATIRFEVEDTGIGIAESEIERIFEPFVQADDSSTRKYGGTGLGLAISRRLSRLMGGELTARSDLGVGSTFTVELPVQPPHGSVPSMLELPRAPRMTSPENVSGRLDRLLLISSDEDLHDAFSHALLRHGVELRTAFDAEHGFADARAYLPQCILLHMGAATSDKSIDVEEWLSTHRGDAAMAHIPVVLLASRTLTELERRSLKGQVARIFPLPLMNIDEIADFLTQ